RFLVRKVEDLAEGIDLPFGHQAVGLRHLRRQRNDRHGKGDHPARFGVPLEQRPDGIDHTPERIAGGIADRAEEPVPQGGNLEAGKIEKHAANDQIIAASARSRSTLKRLNYVHLSETNIAKFSLPPDPEGIDVPSRIIPSVLPPRWPGAFRAVFHMPADGSRELNRLDRPDDRKEPRNARFS